MINSGKFFRATVVSTLEMLHIIRICFMYEIKLRRIMEFFRITLKTLHILLKSDSYMKF